MSGNVLVNRKIVIVINDFLSWHKEALFRPHSRFLLLQMTDTLYYVWDMLPTGIFFALPFHLRRSKKMPPPQALAWQGFAGFQMPKKVQGFSVDAKPRFSGLYQPELSGEQPNRKFADSFPDKTACFFHTLLLSFE